MTVTCNPPVPAGSLQAVCGWVLQGVILITASVNQKLLQRVHEHGADVRPKDSPLIGLL